MPSRRRLLAALGTATVGAVAGCATIGTTSGLVARKQIGVAVPRSDGTPIDVTIALLTFEPDRALVTGEYADIAAEAIRGATIGASERLHDRLSDRFSAVRYFVNVVPEDGATPADGLVTRRDFNALPIGGTAAVVPYTGVDGVGRLRLSRATPRRREPAEVTIDPYSFADRMDGLRR